MTLRTLKIDAALRALPDADAMAPLREALLEGARTVPGPEWDDGDPFATLETQPVDADALEERVAVLAERVRARAERIMRQGVAALRAVEAGDWAGAARALVAAGEEEERARRLAEAERCYARAAELGRKARDRVPEGLALRRQGRVARAAGRWDEAERFYSASFRVAEAQGDSEGMVVACQGLGNVAVDRGRWDDALAWYRRGMERSPAEPPRPERVHLCNGLAVAERRRGELEGAAAWLAEGERTARALGDGGVLGYVENGWGMLHLARGDPATAEAAFRRALARPLDPVARATVTVNLADPLLRQGRLREAAAVAREAEALALEHRAALKLPDVYRTLGAVAAARRERDGFVFFEQALEICRGHALPRFEEAVTQHHYGRFEAALGDPDAARARLEEAVRLYEEAGARVDARAVGAERAALAAEPRNPNG